MLMFWYPLKCSILQLSESPVDAKSQVALPLLQLRSHRQSMTAADSLFMSAARRGLSLIYTYRRA